MTQAEFSFAMESHFCLKVRFRLQPIHRFAAHTLPITHYQLPTSIQVENRKSKNRKSLPPTTYPLSTAHYPLSYGYRRAAVLTDARRFDIPRHQQEFFREYVAMLQTRKQFMVCGAAAVAAGSAFSFGDEKPRLRIGAMTDNHLHPKRKETHEKTAACFRLFKKMGVDIVVDTGDIADLSHPSELKFFRACFDENFAGTATVPFFCIANHDYNYLPNTKRNDPSIIEAAARYLGMDSINPCATVKGYHFVSYHQYEKIEVLEKGIQDALATNEGKRPVFVITHVPPFETTTGTSHWSSRGIRRVLNKYPQILNLTGHIHTSITWSANIWQGEFTAINLGAHAQYSNPIGGEAVVLDVFDNRIDVRRYEAISGREIGADDRWSIPLPLDPAHGPYRLESRMKAIPPPSFPEEVKASYSQSPNGSSGTLSFTAARPLGKAYRYNIRLESQDASGKWHFIGAMNHEPAQVMDAPAMCDCPIIPVSLDSGRRHRATISPIDSFGAIGTARQFLFDVPETTMEELPADVVKVDRVISGTSAESAPMKPDADGWYTLDRDGAIVLSPSLSKALVGRKNPTLVVDLGTDQQETPRTLSIATFSHGKGAAKFGIGERLAERIYTLPGKYETQRYAWRLRLGGKFAEDDVIFVHSREGGKARYKINSVRGFVSRK